MNLSANSRQTEHQMTHNPLLKVLPFLRKKEMTRFREFAFSPYFNKHQGVQKLVARLSETYPHFDEKRYERKVLHALLFPGQPHDQPKLALLFTYALRLLEKFIQTEECSKNGVLAQPHRLLHFLQERGIYFYLEKKWKENFKGGKYSIEKKPLGWAGEMDAAAMHLGRYERDFLSEKQRHADALFIQEKLRDGCELLLRSNYLKREFEESPMLRAACGELEKSPGKYQAYPAAALYFRCFRLLSKGEASDYEGVFKTVEAEAPKLDMKALQSLFRYLQNFCIAQINLGNEPFLRHIFDIYRSQLDRSLLLVNERLPEWHFKNIVTSGLRLDEHEWVRQFLDEYRPWLPPEVAENAYSYNLASYYYHLKKYDEVLGLLVQVEYTDQRYNLGAKSLLLRTYFDLDEEEPLMALCGAFRQYLKRNRALTEFQKKGYTNLIKFTRRAFRLKSNRGFWSTKKWETEKGKLLADIEGAGAIFNLKWLEEKLAGI